MKMKFLQWSLQRNFSVFTRMIHKMEKLNEKIIEKQCRNIDVIEAIQREVDVLSSMKNSNDKLLTNIKKLVG